MYKCRACTCAPTFAGTGHAGDCSTGQVSVSVGGNACGRAATVSVLGDASGGSVNVDLQ